MAVAGQLSLMVISIGFGILKPWPLKVVLDNSDEFRWIAVAIGQEPRRPEENESQPDPLGGKSGVSTAAASEASGG